MTSISTSRKRAFNLEISSVDCPAGIDSTLTEPVALAARHMALDVGGIFDP
jgi:hypothetical protein